MHETDATMIDVAPREQVRRRRVPEPVDVVVARAVLLDVEVGLRDVRLGLVVVVVGDEVLDRVVREELAELVAELRGERLVVRDHERRPLDLLDDPGHRRRLAGAGRAEQRLVALARARARRRASRSPRLVAGRRVVAAVFSSGMRVPAYPSARGPSRRESSGRRRRTGEPPPSREPGPRDRAGSASAQSPQSKSRERDQRLSSEASSEPAPRPLGRCCGCAGASMNVSSAAGQSSDVGSSTIDCDAVHRVLDARLLLGLEERVVLERIVGHVLLERHLVLERRVAPLQLEVLLDHLREQRRESRRRMLSSCSDAIPSGAGV